MGVCVCAASANRERGAIEREKKQEAVTQRRTDAAPNAAVFLAAAAAARKTNAQHNNVRNAKRAAR
jgi:hypothetical protein